MSFLKVPVFGAQPYGFKATDVSGCKAWFDAADVSTLYTTTPINGITTGFSDYTSANGQRVTVWEDKSTGGNDMIRNVNASSFTDTSAQYLGPPIVAPDSYPTTLAVVNLDQGNVAPGADAGGTSNSPSFLQQNLVAVGDYTASGGPGSARGPRVGTGISATTDIFIVVKPKFLNVAGDVFSIGSQPGKSADFTCLSITSSGYWKINSQGGARDVTASTTEVFDTFSNLRGPDPNYRILHMSLSNNNYILRRNSSQIGINTGYTWSPNLANFRYYIGRKNSTDNAGNYFNGKIGEIIVYNNIITTEKRLIVESYLANKWNLIDLLPADHPARLQNIPISLGGISMAAAPNGFVRRAVIIKIRTPPPPLLNAPTISFGAININWTSPANIFDIIIQQSSDDVSFANYLTFINQLLDPPTFSYNLVTGSEYGKYYKFRILAKSGPVSSAYATSVSVYAPYIPAVPSSLDTDSALNLFQMQWGDVGSNYSIQIYTYFNNAYTLIETILTNDTSYEYPITITAVYTFKVAGKNAIGQSAYSDYGTNRSIEYIPLT